MALITVIVLSGVLLASGIAIVLMVADLAIATESFTSRFRLEGTVRTCLEESLFKVKADPEFVGLVSYTNSGDSCDADVSDDLVDPSIKIVDITASIDGFSLVRSYSVDISQEPFQILDL